MYTAFKMAYRKTHVYKTTIEACRPVSSQGVDLGEGGSFSYWYYTAQWLASPAFLL